MAAMEHVYIVYFFATFALGLVSLAIAINIYVETRETLIRYFLYFYVPFTLIVMISASLLYIRANIPDIVQPYVLHPLRYLETILLYLLIFTIPVFAHALYSVPHANVKNRIFGGIAIITYLGSRFLVVAIEQETFRLVGMYMGAIIFLCIIIYVLLTGIYHYKKLEEGRQKKLAMKILILLSLFLPALIHDFFPVFHPSIRFFPILYCGFSIVFTHHLLTYHHHHQASTPTPSQTLPPAPSEEEMFAHYDISPREQEIVSLLLQGYSNQKIADTLCITLSTVKTHLRNIYPKFGVNSRYELLTLFKNSGELPSSETPTRDV